MARYSPAVTPLDTVVPVTYTLSSFLLQYTLNEMVPLWLNKVGPYHNPQEAYTYYTLPFCAPPTELEPATKFAGIGEVLEGTEFVNSGLEVKFRGACCVARCPPLPLRS